jgi:hypothetical protein
VARRLPSPWGAPDECAVRGIAVDRTYVYWGDCSLLMSIPLSGGTPASLASANAAITELAIDATNVYWAANTTGPGTVGKIPLGGGTPVFLGQGYPQGGIAVDSANVYWAGQGALYSVPIAGGATQTLAGEPLGPLTPYGVAVDATSVYWTIPEVGSVMKLTPK